mgnify:CR=1 FL=1
MTDNSGMTIRRIWLAPDTKVIHAMDPILPHSFSLCGIGCSTGFRYVYQTEEPRTITCLACLALTTTTA